MIDNTDIAKVMRNLHNMERYLDNEINAQQVFQKAGKLVISEMRSNAPEDEGALKKSIQIIKTKGHNRKRIVIGPKFPLPRTHRPTNHPYLAEFGHIAVNGKYIPGTPFVRRTYETTKNLILMTMLREMKEAFNRAGKSSAGFI